MIEQQILAEAGQGGEPAGRAVRWGRVGLITLVLIVLNTGGSPTPR